jgi:hypothetical protein
MSATYSPRAIDFYSLALRSSTIARAVDMHITPLTSGTTNFNTSVESVQTLTFPYAKKPAECVEPKLTNSRKCVWHLQHKLLPASMHTLDDRTRAQNLTRVNLHVTPCITQRKINHSAACKKSWLHATYILQVCVINKTRYQFETDAYSTCTGSQLTIEYKSVWFAQSVELSPIYCAHHAVGIGFDPQGRQVDSDFHPFVVGKLKSG